MTGASPKTRVVIVFCWSPLFICRVGQNHIYTVYIRYYWQGNHQIYGHIWCIYTVYLYGSGQPYLFASDILIFYILYAQLAVHWIVTC